MVGRQQRLVGDVEAHHRQVDVGGEHAVRRLGIAPDVELGGGRHVALPDRAAHEHDPLDPRLDPGITRQQQRDVGERPDGYQRDRSRRRLQRRRDPVNGVSLLRRPARRGQFGAFEAGLAVDVGGNLQLAHERAIGPGGDGHIGPPGAVQHPDGVRGRLGQRLVPRHGRHAQQLDLVAGQRQEQRGRVVVARVAVDDDRLHRADTTSRVIDQPRCRWEPLARHQPLSGGPHG